MNFFDKVIQIFSSIIFQNDLLIQEGMAQEEEKTKKLQEVIKICHSVKLPVLVSFRADSESDSQSINNKYEIFM